jgi:hypothetical protein
MFFSEFSDVLHNEDDFSSSELIDLIFDRVFFEFNMIEAHSRFELVIDKKEEHLCDD